LHRPTKKFGANISYQFTQGNIDPNAFSLTKYHIPDDESLNDFINSYDDSQQPKFTKHLINAHIESKVNDRFGFIAAFQTTQSFIPLRRNDDSYLSTSGNYQATPIDPTDSASAKQNQKRQIYNYMLKGYYDIDDSVRLELSYTYAPQYDYRFIVGTKNDLYNFESGGHQVGLKTIWDNALGLLTNTLSYGYLENSTTTNFGATKYWQASDSKAWSNWATWVRSGGYAPSDSIQHTASNKLIQEFHPFEVLHTTHHFQAGLEFSYQNASFGYSKPYDSAVKTSEHMTQNQQTICATTNQEWCDVNKAYDPRKFDMYDGINVTKESFEGREIYVWPFGQYFTNITRFRSDKKINLDNAVFALFLQDDITLPLWKLGELNIRPGLRVDSDSYMGKMTLGHRLSLNYSAPWNNRESGHRFATQLIGGINRYYGRNIFTYRLRDGMNSLKTDIYRDNPGTSWESLLATGRECAPLEYATRNRVDRGDGVKEWKYYNDNNKEVIQDTNCIESYENSYKFSKLKVPYVDEFMIGFAQGFYDFALSAKYIYRVGKDDIRLLRSDYGNLPKDPNYSSTYYVYTNEGKSWTKI